jgi:hypothetical protein
MMPNCCPDFLKRYKKWCGLIKSYVSYNSMP